MKGYIQGYGEEVLSGGRYDKLISEFGYDVPATGFAVNVDAIAEMLKRNLTEKKNADFVIFSDEEHAMDALIYAQKLRDNGNIVEYSPFDTLEETKKYCETKGNPRIIIFEVEKMNKPIRIALTKGRLEKDTVALFEKIGYDCTSVHEKGRKLILPIPDANIEVVLAKAADVITYVEHGVCDMCVVGKIP